MNPKLLRMKDVAQMLGISKSYAYKLTRRGQLPAVRLGRSVRVRPDDLMRFISDNLTKGQPNILSKTGAEDQYD